MPPLSNVLNSSKSIHQLILYSLLTQYIYRNGEPMLPDYHQLADDDGKSVCCYHCRRSALYQVIIKCDFCTAFWHLHCPDSPLTTPPDILRKWMRPLPIEQPKVSTDCARDLTCLTNVRL